MQPVLLPLRLNCPWQATATTAMVRSPMWVPTAAIGQVPWLVPTRGACTSTVAVPTCAATAGRSEVLCVALRNIDTSDLFDTLTLKLPVPPFRWTGSFVFFFEMNIAQKIEESTDTT